MIYFDYTATTKPNQLLLDLHTKISNEYWYNSETLYHEGERSHNLYLKSEKVALDALNLKHHKILFTSGATESNNTAIYSACHAYLNINNTKPKHIITTLIEHASVLKAFKDLENRGFNVTYLKPNNEGIINVEDLKQAITPDTILVSIMWVNNLMGTVQPIKDVINLLKEYPRIKLHVDAVQGITKIVPDFDLNDIDYLTISGHKLNGLKGTGMLCFNENLFVEFLQGGHQQYGFRPGTVDLAGVVCMAKTISLAAKDIEEKYNDVLKKYNYLINNLKDEKHLYLNYSKKHFSPYILSIAFYNLKGETALHALEEKGIIVGTGSACNSQSKEIENTYKYSLDGIANPINVIRISISLETTYEELDQLITNLKQIGK